MSNRIYQRPHHLEEDDNRSISSSQSLTRTESTRLLKQECLDHTTVRQELKWLFCNSLPIIGTYLLQNSFQLTSIHTLGHLVSLSTCARLYTIHVDHGTIKLCLELYICLYFWYGIYWSTFSNKF
jgi:hypothetical protein